jgi:Protein of unknown function (DUF1579)
MVPQMLRSSLGKKIRAVGSLSLLVLRIGAIASIAQEQNPATTVKGPPDALLLIQGMAGTWNVTQRMWSGPGASPTELPAALAHRRVLAGTIVEEEMELAPGAKGDAFTRIAYLDYNAMNRQYEYFSIDTRAPQMMRESSCENVTQDKRKDRGLISLCGGMFVAATWGTAKNAAFRYRLVVDAVSENQQIVRLYLTPVSSEIADEFLAFEYVYTRRS